MIHSSNSINICLEDVLHHIEQANHQEVETLIHALRRRFSSIHPGWELLLFTLQTGNEAECPRQIKEIIDFLSVHYLKEPGAQNLR